MSKRLKKCPVCNLDLEIKEYYCRDCDVTIRGSFSQGDLSALSLAQQEFVKVFLMAQGSIKEVEKRLKISYPTVKSRLSEITDVIGERDQEHADMTDILSNIEGGELTVEQAIEHIKKFKGEADDNL